MKKYHFNFSRWNEKENCEEIAIPGEFYLASDVDALRAGAVDRALNALAGRTMYATFSHAELKDIATRIVDAILGKEVSDE